ncbi:GPH family glycoside/pentoside/hexuronide:cation symporter [Anaerosolibacter carboniphilus]|uniref:GPH family glycoside/pentoside/hexuronide:cation symporter n=1 Tax=Anaerosolibacter carboniphilus TaxID=1417629 RepID=A0A841L4T4_9FIRM|nr:MFS transporter [Anaerosolibacter carboniphilus]MBB6217335.1 GPH family glycoside/pentoside/hexuronide:cation symporter [Anaerosolibacter carboniphilus]
MKKPLSKAIKTFYGVGDLGFSLMTSVELYCFVFFMTNVAKFSLPMVALIGSITSIVDACLSPFYGAIISGTKALKWGRNRSWMLIAPPFVVLLFMFQFTKIGPEPIAAAIVCAGFILSHIVWNIAWVGNVSLIPLLANNPEERGLLASRRAFWTSLSGVFFSYIGTPFAILLGRATGNDVLGYTLLAGTMALAMMIGYWTVFKITDGYEPIEDESQGAGKSERVSVSIMLKTAFQNPPLLILLVGDFFRYMTNFIMTAAAAYYFTYVAQNMALLPVYLLVGAIAQVVGSYISGAMAKALSLRTASIVGLFGLAGSLVACKFVAMNVTMFFIVVCIARAFLGILAAVMVALYSDVAIYGEWKTGKNASPFVMGLMNLSLKTAVISRGTIIPIVLAAAGFVVGADPATASLELKNAVNTVFLFIPGIFALVSALIMTFGYRLTREKVVAYQAEINERKAQVV